MNRFSSRDYSQFKVQCWYSACYHALAGKSPRPPPLAGYEAQGTTEGRKKGAEMPAFLWTTAFLFLLSSRFQSDVTSEPPKTANRA